MIVRWTWENLAVCTMMWIQFTFLTKRHFSYKTWVNNKMVPFQCVQSVILLLTQTDSHGKNTQNQWAMEQNVCQNSVWVLVLLSFGWNFCYSCAALVSKLGQHCSKHCRKGCSTLQQLLQPMLMRLPALQKDPVHFTAIHIHCSAMNSHSLQCNASIQKWLTWITEISTKCYTKTHLKHSAP